MLAEAYVHNRYETVYATCTLACTYLCTSWRTFLCTYSGRLCDNCAFVKYATVPTDVRASVIVCHV
jgi:hypothetical protein